MLQKSITALLLFSLGFLAVGSERIDLIATANIAGIGDVTVFVRAFDFGNSPLDINKVADALGAILDYIAANGRNFGPAGDLDIAFGFIGNETTDDKADAIMSRLAQRHPNIPLVLVYCTAGCNGPNPTYKLRFRGMSEANAKKIACDMGFTVFCDGYRKPRPPSTLIVPQPSCCLRFTPEGMRLEVLLRRSR